MHRDFPLEVSGVRGERLDAPRIAHERNHDGDPAEKQEALHDVNTVRTEIEQVAERPARRECGAENLSADENGRADHREHILPYNAAALAAFTRVHRERPKSRGIARSLHVEERRIDERSADAKADLAQFPSR